MRGAGAGLLTWAALSQSIPGEPLACPTAACLLPSARLKRATPLSLELPRVCIPGGGGNDGLLTISGNGLDTAAMVVRSAREIASGGTS